MATTSNKNEKKKGTKSLVFEETPIKILGSKDSVPAKAESSKKLKGAEKKTPSATDQEKISKGVDELLKEYAAEKHKFNEKLQALILEKQNMCKERLESMKKKTPKLIAIQKEKEKILQEAFADVKNAKESAKSVPDKSKSTKTAKQPKEKEVTFKKTAPQKKTKPQEAKKQKNLDSVKSAQKT